jgi:deoxycytidine triphosphate deaminase
LIESGDIVISGRTPKHKHGVLWFHASEKITRVHSEHVVLYADKRVEGLSSETNREKKHVLRPGAFADIETEESLHLSDTVAIFVKYGFISGTLAGEPLFCSDADDITDFLMTASTSGGWIDPSYQGMFSVQRKAYRKPITVTAGDLVAAGVVFHFPDGVERGYGSSRGSHYQHSTSFIDGG